MTTKKIRTAVIDVGTLKSKFEVREFDQGMKFSVVTRQKELTVLGRDLDKTNNVIIEKAINTTIYALKKFRSEIKKLKVDKYMAVGTEAIRKAVNADEVLKRIELETGIKLQILDHESEAEIYFRSVSKDFPGQKIAVSDIGGGSVQVVIGKDVKILETYLFKTGTYFMQETFSKTHHPTLEELKKAIDYVRQELKPLAKTKQSVDLLVYGTTNIIDFFKAMDIELLVNEKYEDHQFWTHIQNLHPLYEKIVALSYEDRMSMYPAEPYYMWAADKALMNIFQISKYLKVDKIVPSNSNISSGILYSLAEQVWKK